MKCFLIGFSIVAVTAVSLFPKERLELIGIASVEHVSENLAAHLRSRRSDPPLPGSLSFRFSVAGDNVRLNLERNLKLNHHPPVFVVRKGRAVRRDQKDVQQDSVGYYQDVRKGAAIMVRKQNTNRAKYELMGTYYVRDKQYSIQPIKIEHHADRKQNYVNHTIARLMTHFDLRNDMMNFAQQRERLYDVIKTRHKRAIRTYTIELLMVTDFAVFNTWFSMADGTDKKIRTQNTYDVISQYYAFVLNGIDLRYGSIEEADFRIDVTFAGIVIIDDPAESYWTVNFANVSPDGLVESSDALEAFRSWALNNDTILPPNDHVMLFTGYNLTYGGSTSNAGLAYIRSLCNPEYSISIVEEYFESRVVAIAAHELGHSLGARHDMDGNKCFAFYLYIMTSRFRFPTKSKATNPWRFSKCSIQYFREYIDTLNRNSSNCLLTKDSPADNREIAAFLGDQPGQVYSLDGQCRMAVSNESYACRGQVRRDFATVCSKGLSCRLPNSDAACTKILPAEGTPCGSRKWCRSGLCEVGEAASALDDNCPLGDQPLPLTGGKTCTQRIEANSRECYNKEFEDACCKSCGSIQTGLPGCEYGDRNFTCVPEECPSYSQETRDVGCCQTCHYFFNPTTTGDGTTVFGDLTSIMLNMTDKMDQVNGSDSTDLSTVSSTMDSTNMLGITEPTNVPGITDPTNVFGVTPDVINMTDSEVDFDTTDSTSTLRLTDSTVMIDTSPSDVTDTSNPTNVGASTNSTNVGTQTNPTKMNHTSSPSDMTAKPNPTVVTGTSDSTKVSDTSDPTNEVNTPGPTNMPDIPNPTNIAATSDTTNEFGTSESTRRFDKTHPPSLVDVTKPNNVIGISSSYQVTDTTDPSVLIGISALTNMIPITEPSNSVDVTVSTNVIDIEDPSNAIATKGLSNVIATTNSPNGVSRGSNKDFTESDLPHTHKAGLTAFPYSPSTSSGPRDEFSNPADKTMTSTHSLASPTGSSITAIPKGFSTQNKPTDSESVTIPVVTTKRQTGSIDPSQKVSFSSTVPSDNSATPSVISSAVSQVTNAVTPVPTASDISNRSYEYDSDGGSNSSAESHENVEQRKVDEEKWKRLRKEKLHVKKQRRKEEKRERKELLRRLKQRRKEKKQENNKNEEAINSEKKMQTGSEQSRNGVKRGQSEEKQDAHHEEEEEEEEEGNGFKTKNEKDKREKKDGKRTKKDEKEGKKQNQEDKEHKEHKKIKEEEKKERKIKREVEKKKKKTKKEDEEVEEISKPDDNCDDQGETKAGYIPEPNEIIVGDTTDNGPDPSETIVTRRLLSLSPESGIFEHKDVNIILQRKQKDTKLAERNEKLQVNVAKKDDGRNDNKGEMEVREWAENEIEKERQKLQKEMAKSAKKSKCAENGEGKRKRKGIKDKEGKAGFGEKKPQHETSRDQNKIKEERTGIQGNRNPNTVYVGGGDGLWIFHGLIQPAMYTRGTWYTLLQHERRQKQRDKQWRENKELVGGNARKIKPRTLIDSKHIVKQTDGFGKEGNRRRVYDKDGVSGPTGTETRRPHNRKILDRILAKSGNQRGKRIDKEWISNNSGEQDCNEGTNELALEFR